MLELVASCILRVVTIAFQVRQGSVQALRDDLESASESTHPTVTVRRVQLVRGMLPRVCASVSRVPCRAGGGTASTTA